ncbi:prephenate dehydrogenase/arogenate dehydrogenase family protein [bacterium]|nr:MAG: prephenate dehydrogenase/arogenate dehydrogenase family protein [bacterium]
MRIAIVGTGLIGASLGLAWRAAGHWVAGADSDPSALKTALERGALDAVVTPAQAREAQVLVLAMPLDAVCAMLTELVALRQPPELVLDVASLQEPVLRAGRGLSTLVATHPMAGREGGGAGLAEAELFRGRTWIYEPGSGAAHAIALRLIGETGARALPMEARSHDRAVAITSHLPQLLALGLAHCVSRHREEPGVCEAAGPGLRSALRLANARWTMWRPLLEAQRSRDAELLDEVAARLEAFARTLRAGDEELLRAAFDEGAMLSGALFHHMEDAEGGQDSA